MFTEDPLKGKREELRTRYKAEVSNAEIQGEPKPPAFEDWIKEKGYAMSGGQLVNAK